MDQGEESVLVQNFLKYGSIYVVASPDTTVEEWEAKTFGIATEQESLRLFISREDALLYANAIRSVLPNGTIMVMKTSQAMSKSLIFDYSRKGFISGVWLCGKTPIRARVGVEPFIQNIKRDSPSTITGDRIVNKPVELPEPEAPQREDQNPQLVADSADNNTSVNTVTTNNNPPQPHGDFKFVEEVRTVLSESSAAERKKIDPSGSYLNLHLLMEKLICANEIEFSAMDSALDLPDGYTKNMVTNVTGCEVPKDIVWKYLNYFGLNEFLYLFKGQSLEIADELKKSSKIDPYVIKQATVHADERFTLMKIKPGKFKREFNIFQLVFKSEFREVAVTSSTKLDMILGKDYVLQGITPPDRGSTSNVSVKDAMGATPAALPTKDEEEAILKQMEEQAAKKKDGGRQGRTGRPSQSMPPQRKPPQDGKKTGKDRYMITPEERMAQDTQTVLAWIIKTKHIGEREARKEMIGFDDDPEAMASFAKYLKEGKADGKFLRRGYSPRRLMHDLHYSPIDAYTMMADLKRKPDDTMQRLKYRETDPQYQTKKTESSN